MPGAKDAGAARAKQVRRWILQTGRVEQVQSRALSKYAKQRKHLCCHSKSFVKESDGRLVKGSSRALSKHVRPSRQSHRQTHCFASERRPGIHSMCQVGSVMKFKFGYLGKLSDRKLSIGVWPDA